MSEDNPPANDGIVDVALAAVVWPWPGPAAGGGSEGGAGSGVAGSAAHDEPRVLITRRPADRVYAGYWELPGGKCEAGETPAQCVVREVEEEVAIGVTPRRALSVVEHVYEHAHVRLHPWLCEPTQPAMARPVEAAALEWVAPAGLVDYPFPEANGPILEELIAWLSGQVPAGDPGGDKARI